MKFQELILSLQRFWADRGCVIQQPYDIEVGAGTFNPATFFRVLGPEPWRVAYVEPSRRPADGRYGENPNRLQHYYQFQVILKPVPDDIQDIYLQSLASLGLKKDEHDFRFVEDDWESPTLGAWGLGWEGWLERIAMYLQGVDNVFDLVWADGMTYGDIHHRTEVEFSRYNFEEADIEMLFSLFKMYENESLSLIAKGLILPAYDYCLKTSHIFNLLDARKAISVAERTGYIARVRNLARRCAEGYSTQPAVKG